MLVQVVDPLDHPAVPGPGQRDVIEHGQVLDELAQPDAAGVRADRHAELGREEQVGQVLVNPGDPAGVDLHHIDRPGLEQLLEDDPVGHVLAGRHPDGLDALPDRGGAEDVPGAGRLLDPGRAQLGQLAHPGDSGRHVPHLVGVDGDADLLAHRRAGQGQAPPIVGELGAHLEFHLGEPVVNRLRAEPRELVVGVAEPAGCRGIGRVTVPLQRPGAFRPASLSPFQQVQRLVGSEGVSEVAEVDEADDLFRGQLSQQPPQRFPGPPRGQVPARVHDGADRHVRDAAFRPQPAQRAVRDQRPVQAAQVGQDLVHVPPGEERLQRADRGHLHLVAPADREHVGVARQRLAGAGEIGLTRPDHEVSRGVIRAGVHRVRAVQPQRGREADVVGVETNDPGHTALSLGGIPGPGWLVTVPAPGTAQRRERRHQAGARAG